MDQNSAGDAGPARDGTGRLADRDAISDLISGEQPEDDVTGHISGPLDPKLIGSDEVDALGLTGALKDPGAPGLTGALKEQGER